jgi:hypothetical protein
VGNYECKVSDHGLKFMGPYLSQKLPEALKYAPTKNQEEVGPYDELFAFMKRTETSSKKKLVKVRHLAVTVDIRTTRCNRRVLAPAL